ncbi:MAG: oligopeptide transporter, OPT family [Candidatus Aminicenantes bacterium]|nr:oligopeptide transporter, OPT family [Candidatus Aminicenantes bacterium]NIM84587.1 oligopeptide transporter, OPT family [Candidatus Aminicenantes bacterium]NIN24109.1 oligopeptide transporter, OPT family [Candidatus Aminicenantes bacterium]NIN47815.1 oligopeptide transporter, OPT family [Candidatus Aminicenantes bacterium]NIN90753.1 oligopeptide transporter, OPT family [Candidatus Aminicenantes bacterium]
MSISNSSTNNSSPISGFKPYVPASTVMKDFNVKTVILGIFLGAVFGSANAYLGLKVGLTISTAIPLAVISVAILRLLTPIFGRSTILECNISQTTGSASSSLASGIIFTIPALFIWGYVPSLLQMTLLAICGGILGVLFMIPLRNFLIVKEHQTLPYPEGTASAEVLIAASEGGSTAKYVFVGLGLGALYKGFLSLLYLWTDKVQIYLPLIKKGVIGISTTPALMGVGYILGRRIGTILVAGGLVSWVLIIPIIAWQFGDTEIWSKTLEYLKTKEGFDTSIRLIGELSAKEIWEGYIRIIGAGAVAAAGIITVIKSIPTMFNSLKVGVRQLKESAVALDKGKLRTERDLSIKYVIIGVLLIIMAITFLPGIIGGDFTMIISFPAWLPLPDLEIAVSATTMMRFLSSLAIVFFAFCFVTVSSRIVGMIGVSSNPTSGMAIFTLMGTGLIFYFLGWTDLTGKITALTIGTIVCIAASIAGDISQDLKAGFIVGATPRKQQMGEILGAMGSAFFVCVAVFYLGKAYGFGTEEMPAPQATLMKTVLDGVLGGDLRWDLVGIGAVFALLVVLFKVPPLPFAVGMYLPLYTMTPVFIGGMIRHVIEKKYGQDKEKVERGKDQGILLGSGLIAGEGLMGVAIAIIAVITAQKPKFFEIPYPAEWMSMVVAGLVFVGLGWYLYGVAARSRKS